MPDFSHERRASGIVCGIDEAGRGPWAGPVVAAAVVLGADEECRARLPDELADELDDSKRVAPARRAALATLLEDCATRGLIRISVAAASVTEIDRINILAATHLAMARAVAGLGAVPDLALVDGNRAPQLPCPVECLVGGDGISLSIAAASILAKVMRDRLMVRLAARYPSYGWQQNMGYGTELHREGLWRNGVTPHHRASFAPVRERVLALAP
jgi:ribonuclease HII